MSPGDRGHALLHLLDKGMNRSAKQRLAMEATRTPLADQCVPSELLLPEQKETSIRFGNKPFKLGRVCRIRGTSTQPSLLGVSTLRLLIFGFWVNRISNGSRLSFYCASGWATVPTPVTHTGRCIIAASGFFCARGSRDSVLIPNG